MTLSHSYRDDQEFITFKQALVTAGLTSVEAVCCSHPTHMDDAIFTPCLELKQYVCMKLSFT